MKQIRKYICSDETEKICQEVRSAIQGSTYYKVSGRVRAEIYRQITIQVRNRIFQMRILQHKYETN